MDGLTSHRHERLTNTKRKQKKWKRMEENGGTMVPSEWVVLSFVP